MLPVSPPVEPMLAKLAAALPRGPGLVYEPKWDGFRTLVFRDGGHVYLQSRNGQPLARYFPELLEPLRRALPARAVVDGELVVAGASGLDFDALLQRIHPAASRIRELARRTPASFVAFDLLALGDRDLRPEPFVERRAVLARALRPQRGSVLLTPATDDPDVAEGFVSRFEGAGLDGAVAKRTDLPYAEGERAMWKVKPERTADCVIGGYRRHKDGGVGSLLLGLHDEDGVLRHVGHAAGFPAKRRRELEELLAPLRGGASFGEGFAPGGPSRWSRGRDTSYVSVTPSLVCEVAFDRLTAGRFRHAARLLRLRPDKSPESCTLAELEPPRVVRLAELESLSSGVTPG